jgi:hypothetical protein
MPAKSGVNDVRQTLPLHAYVCTDPESRDTYRFQNMWRPQIQVNRLYQKLFE